MARLRKFKMTDKLDTVDLIGQFFNYHRSLKQAPLMSSEEMEATLADWINNHTLLVYEVADAIIGLVRLRREGTVYWLEDVMIHSTMQGQGHGKHLLSCIEDYLLKKGQESVYVFVIPENTRAIDFYVANGFTTLNMIELRKDINKENHVEPCFYKGSNFSLSWAVDKYSKS